MNKLREAIAEIICKEAESAFYANPTEDYDEFAATLDDYLDEADEILKLVAKELLEGKPNNREIELYAGHEYSSTGVEWNNALQAFENHIKSKLGVEDD